MWMKNLNLKIKTINFLDRKTEISNDKYPKQMKQVNLTEITKETDRVSNRLSKTLEKHTESFKETETKKIEETNFFVCCFYNNS